MWYEISAIAIKDKVSLPVCIKKLKSAKSRRAPPTVDILEKNRMAISTSPHLIRTIPKPRASDVRFFPQTSTPKASFKKDDFFLSTRRTHKPPKRLIKISTADGRWHGKWNLEYNLSLHQLQLHDLTEECDRRKDVSIALHIQKHTGFGLSVDGKIVTSFTSKCSNCSATYCKEIDTNFNAWILPYSRQRSSRIELPEIGGDDPSVIYVKPGCEADLDTLIQDTIRLAIAVQGTCSAPCEKSEPKLQYIGEKYAASVDKRWSRLLELRT